LQILLEKQFEDAKWIIRSRKSENNRQHNGQKKSVIYGFQLLQYLTECINASNSIRLTLPRLRYTSKMAL
jgi:hypothetical protein